MRAARVPMIARGIETGQPLASLVRAPQLGKYFAYQHQALPLASGARGVRLPLSIDGDSDFLLQEIACLFDNGGAKFQLQLSPQNTNYNAVPLFFSNSGSGQRRFPVNPPLILNRNAVWTLVLDDRQLVPADNNILVAYHGTKVYDVPLFPARRYRECQWFSYAASYCADDQDGNGGPLGPIPPGATRPFAFQIDGDSDFEVQRITVVSDAPVTVQIDNARDFWFQLPMRGELLSGSPIEQTTFPYDFSGEWTFELPGPRLIQARGYVSTSVANLDPDHDNRVQIVFWGTRYFPGGGL